MKTFYMVLGALGLFATIALIAFGLLFSKSQTEQLAYGIYAIAFGVLTLVLLEASKDTTQV